MSCSVAQCVTWWLLQVGCPHMVCSVVLLHGMSSLCGVMCGVVAQCHCIVRCTVWVAGCVVLVWCDVQCCRVVHCAVWVVVCVILVWCDVQCC